MVEDRDCRNVHWQKLHLYSNLHLHLHVQSILCPHMIHMMQSSKYHLLQYQLSILDLGWMKTEIEDAIQRMQIEYVG